MIDNFVILFAEHSCSNTLNSPTRVKCTIILDRRKLLINVSYI